MNNHFSKLSEEWMKESIDHRYSYHFSWLGRPIIQYPQDILAIQALIWEIQPDLIIETGIAHGGSLILSASILELIKGNGVVLGIDIDIRANNRQAIEEHPLSHRIHMLEGSSISSDILAEVSKIAADKQRIMVFLDSMHSHDHVLEELKLYSPFVKKGSYLVVFDTIIEDLPKGYYSDRPWDVGNNPKTAVHSFLKQNQRFEIDTAIQEKLMLTVAPDGYLRCIE